MVTIERQDTPVRGDADRTELDSILGIDPAD